MYIVKIVIIIILNMNVKIKQNGMLLQSNDVSTREQKVESTNSIEIATKQQEHQIKMIENDQNLGGSRITKKRGKSGFIINYKTLNLRENKNKSINKHTLNHSNYFIQLEASHKFKQIQFNSIVNRQKQSKRIDYDKIFQLVTLQHQVNNKPIGIKNNLVQNNSQISQNQLKQSHYDNEHPSENIDKSSERIKDSNINYQNIKNTNKKRFRINTVRINQTLQVPIKQQYQNISLNHQIIQSKTNSYFNPNQPQQKDTARTYNQPIKYRNISNPIKPNHQFTTDFYFENYYALKSIQQNIKNIKCLSAIRSYIALTTRNKLNLLDSFFISLHKKKIIKFALIYEKLAIIALAFNYAEGLIDNNFNYLSNIIKFCLNNYLIILKAFSMENQEKLHLLINHFNKIWSLQQKQFIYNIDTLRNNNEIIFQMIIKVIRQDQQFSDTIRNIIKNHHKFTIQQIFNVFLEAFSIFLTQKNLEDKIPFMAVAPNPYLPVTNIQKFTLVVDFIEVICHSRKADSFRPFTEYFLDQMCNYFEIVSFSVGSVQSINKVLNIFDKNNQIKYRLYRHHAVKVKGTFVRDLKRLGRKSEKVILLISNNQTNEQNMKNTLNIQKWNGSKKDKVLAQICGFLIRVIKKNMNCVQIYQRYNEYLSKNIKEIHNTKNS